jgi:hypothetical protein
MKKAPGSGANAGSPDKVSKFESPSKSPTKSIKGVKEDDLKKHKAQDILGYVKSGNLPMVHGLINYYRLGQAVMLLSGHADEFAMTKTEKVSMS